MIRVGDTVTWKSRSYRRTGKVLAIVPAGQNVDKLVPEDEPISHRNYTTVMKCDRALVEVIAGASTWPTAESSPPTEPSRNM